MHALLFSFGIFLMGMGMFNEKAVKAHLSDFWQWCDYMDVIAVLMVLGVILVNWMGYWL